MNSHWPDIGHGQCNKSYQTLTVSKGNIFYIFFAQAFIKEELVTWHDSNMFFCFRNLQILIYNTYN